MIELRLLGEIRLRASNGADVEALLRQPKRLALLAYLAAPSPGTWHRRDMLLALFWPDLDMAHARTSLRNALYVLRQTLGDQAIRTRGDEEISIDPDEMTTDLAAVWDALRHGRADEALARYGGDLLPGLFPADSEGFQRWLETERTRLKVAVCSTGIAHLDHLEREGRLSEAVAVARRIAEVQPDDETIVRRVMSLHEAMGDRAGALALFESYRGRLASDFDAEPAPETVAIAQRLRASGPVAPPRAKASSKASTSVRLPVDPVTSPDEPDTGIARPPSRNRRVIGSAVVLVAITVVAWIAWNMSRSSTPLSVGNSAPLTADEGLQVEAAISPNGRLVAYAKGNSSKLRIFVQKIGGGAPWALSTDSSAVELMPRWSPDNDELLFLARNNAYASPSLGGSARIIAKGTEGDGMIRSASWSPKGDSVAIVRNDSLLVRPLEGAGSRFVGKGFQLHSCVWSPDGKWIACVSGNLIALTPGPLFGNEAPSAIVLFPVAGGNPVDLTGNEYQNKSPAWSTDGKFLWMLSSRDGISGEAYAVRIGADGRAAGSFHRVGLRAESIGLSAGRIAYSVPVRKANIWSIRIPRDTAIRLAAANQLTSGNQVIELVTASRDGRWLVYDSNLHGNSDIYRIPIEGGAPERLTDDPRPEYAAELSPDGQEITWQRWMSGDRHLFVKRLDSDSAHEVLPVPGDQGVPRWSPDGSALVAWSHTREHGAVFVVQRDSLGRWKRPAWRLEVGQLPIWSPDGRTIAFVKLDGSVETIAADSGARTIVYAPRPGSSDPLAIFLVWSSNPRTVWMMGQGATRQELWALDMVTGRPRIVVRAEGAAGKSFAPSFTADSSRFYFALDERFSNVRWAELIARR
jgi:Tol biopolymer transport system component/DNA-binding SARP family transcriptional activator